MAGDTRAWELVLRRIEGDLLSGALGVGEHLPAERALAAELGVGRSSVREAVRVLEVLGLVRTQTGSGPSAGAVVVSRPDGGLSLLMRLQVAGRGFAVDDIVRTRVLLEQSVASALAAGSPDLTEAEALLDAMDAGSSREEFLVLDTRFHASLAAAAGNQVVAAVMAGLRGSIETYVLAGATALPDWTGTAERLRAEHRALLAAIRSGDADRAARVVTDHITAYYAESHLSERQVTHH
jgi:DNA-binding FadR family transcriptional regulator